MAIPNPNQFKSSSGKWLTQALFFGNPSIYHDRDAQPIYHMDDIRKEYILLGDLTGLKLANKMFGGYPHWKVLMESPWFKENFDLWHEELVTMKIAESLKNIEDIANDESHGQRFQANKFIATKEYETTPSKRGRPSKDEISGNLKQEMRKLSEAEQDLKRMTGNLTVITGGKK